MHLRDALTAAVLLAASLVGLGGQPVYAAPATPVAVIGHVSAGTDDGKTDGLTEEQKDKGAEAAAAVVCGGTGIGSLLDLLDQDCTAAFKPAFKSLSVIDGNALCSQLAEGHEVAGPAIRKACNTLVGDQINAIRDAFFTAAAAVKDGVDTAVKAVQFVTNPDGEIDRLANKMKDGAVTATAELLKKATTTSNPQWDQTWFRDQYVKAISLGVIVMGLMFLLAVKRSATAEDSQETVQSVIKSLPVAVMGMMFTPAVLHVIQDPLNELSLSLAGSTGGGIGNYLTSDAWKALSDPTSQHLTGGVVVGLIVYTLLLLGALATLFGFLMQDFGAYLACLGLGLAWGVYVHPRWRDKTMKIAAFLISLLLMKPLLLLLLGGTFSYLQNRHGKAGDGIEAVAHILLVSGVLVVVGLGPWGLLKFAPLLPNGNEWRQSSAGGALEGGLMMASTGGAAAARSQRISEGRPSTSSPEASTSSGPAGRPGQTGSTGTGGPAGKPGAQGQSGQSGTGTASQGPVTLERRSGGTGQSGASAAVAPRASTSGSTIGAGSASTAGSASANAGRAAAGASQAGAAAATGGVSVAVAAAAQATAIGVRAARQAAEDGVEQAGEHR